jgi:hypothetical protein
MDQSLQQHGYLEREHLLIHTYETNHRKKMTRVNIFRLFQNWFQLHSKRSDSPKHRNEFR